MAVDYRLDDDARDVPLLPFDALARGVQVVVGQHDGVVEDGRKHSGGVGDRVGAGERSRFIQGGLAADGEAVRPSVVAAFELQHLPAAGVGAGHTHRVLQGVGAGVAQGALLGAGNDLPQLLGQLDLEHVGLGHLNAPRRYGFHHGAVELVVGVAQDNGARAGVVVDVLVAVEVPQPVALGPFDVEEVPLPALAIGRASGGVLARLLEIGLRFGQVYFQRYIDHSAPHISFAALPSFRLLAGYGHAACSVKTARGEDIVA